MFPSPTGATYYESYGKVIMDCEYQEFPSPTGATYYEFNIKNPYKSIRKYSFRPQQGLPIMNGKRYTIQNR